MGLYKRWSFKRVAGTKKGLYREQVENDYMQFASWKWVQCGHQQGAQNIEELNLRFQLWSFDWKRFSVFNLRSQEPMTSGVLVVLISGSWSRGWVAHSFARERADQENLRTAALDTYFSIYRNTTRFSEDMSIATNLVPNKNSISFALWEHH